MKKSISWITGIALAASACSASAAHHLLTSYDQLLQAIQAGDDVRAIIHFDKCKMGESINFKSGDSGASMRANFTIFSHYTVPINNQNKYTIATSYTIFTEHRTFGPIYAYMRLRVFEDNSAELHAAYYDPKTFEQKAMVNYNCTISNSDDQNSIYLYDAS